MDPALFAAASRAVHWFELLYTGEVLEKWLVYFLCLIDDLDRSAVSAICRHLEIPPRFLSQLSDEREAARRTLTKLQRRRRDVEPRASVLFKTLNPFSTETLLYMLAKAENEQVRRWISHYFTHLRGVTPLLSGHDLLGMGLQPGPHFKKILEFLRDARLNGRVATREEEITLVRRRFSKNSETSAQG